MGMTRILYFAASVFAFGCPDIMKDNFYLSFIFFFNGIHNWLHRLAGNAVDRTYFDKRDFDDFPVEFVAKEIRFVIAITTKARIVIVAILIFNLERRFISDNLHKCVKRLLCISINPVEDKSHNHNACGNNTDKNNNEWQLHNFF